MPVLGAHAQAGTSGVALALADAGVAAGLSVLLVDCADPARSGLAGVCDSEGRSIAAQGGKAGLRLGVRRLPHGDIAVRRMAATGAPLTAAQVPHLRSWVAADANDFHLTVVDVGWDVWALTAPGASLGPLLWAVGDPGWTFPVLVLRPTAASTALAEGVLARYREGMRFIGLADLHCVVVVGGDRTWPAQVREVMGYHLPQLSKRTMFVAASPEAATTGWSTAPAPPGSVKAAAMLLNSVRSAIAPSNRSGVRGLPDKRTAGPRAKGTTP